MSDFNPDWDKLEAAHEALREHMLIIAELHAALKLCVEALTWNTGGEPMGTLEVKALEAAKAVLEKVEERE